jgi:hypothetical protein
MRVSRAAAPPPKAMIKKVETWRWRYRDPQSGRTRRAADPMSEPEAKKRFPGAERIEGSRMVREVHDDFADTLPRVFRPDQPD